MVPHSFFPLISSSSNTPHLLSLGISLKESNISYVLSHAPYCLMNIHNIIIYCMDILVTYIFSLLSLPNELNNIVLFNPLSTLIKISNLFCHPQIPVKLSPITMNINSLPLVSSTLQKLFLKFII
jgi:hypothetical protein